MASINQTRKQAAAVRQRALSLLVFTFFTAICCGMAVTAKAQTFDEWFKQNSTQTKYLLQQIAALQVFSGYLKQGYGIATNGLGSISGSLKSENALHNTYYNRMNIPSASVKNSDQVKEVLSWQQDILHTLATIDQLNGLTSDEKGYLASVRSAVLQDCSKQIDLLQDLITDGKMKMSDAERLNLLDKIHKAMLENYRFAMSFSIQVKTYMLQRVQNSNEAITEKQLYGIH